MADLTDCAVAGCERARYCRGWCSMHYLRWKRHGDPEYVTPVLNLISRFVMKVDFDGPIMPNMKTPCWVWIGAIISTGYGSLSVDGRATGAHRVSYELFISPIPEGLQPDHLCRNRPCVNPEHLEPVTSGENTRRGNAGVFQKAKTHCPHGHIYNKKNTIINPRGFRECRACCTQRQRDRRARLRGERAYG